MDPNNTPKPGDAGGDNNDAADPIDAALSADAGAGEPDGADLIDAALADDGAAAGGDAAGADGAAAEGADGAAAEDDGKAGDAAAGAEGAAGAQDGKDKPAAGKDGKPEPDAEAVAEAKALGLKDKANERFVAMAGEIKALAPIKAALEQAGIKDVAELPKMVERARAADDMIAMVMETGADAEQYGMTLDYLSLVNKGLRGDRASVEKAFEMVQGEYLNLAKALGREVPGLHDPVAAHPDLVEELRNGDITRARALELAAQRQASSAQQQAAQQAAQQQTQAQQQQQATETGRAAIAQWDQAMRADPKYIAKRAILDPIVRNIRATLPPGQWLAATQQAYAAIPDVPVAQPAAAGGQPQARPLPSAIRGTGAARQLSPTSFDDPMEAMDAALADAAGGR